MALHTRPLGRYAFPARNRSFLRDTRFTLLFTRRVGGSNRYRFRRNMRRRSAALWRLGRRRFIVALTTVSMVAEYSERFEGDNSGLFFGAGVNVRRISKSINIDVWPYKLFLSTRDNLFWRKTRSIYSDRLIRCVRRFGIFRLKRPEWYHDR